MKLIERSTGTPTEEQIKFEKEFKEIIASAIDKIDDLALYFIEKCGDAEKTAYITFTSINDYPSWDKERDRLKTSLYRKQQWFQKSIQDLESAVMFTAKGIYK